LNNVVIPLCHFDENNFFLKRSVLFFIVEMIIHILGKSGSGKTTLGKRLAKLDNTAVLDTDDIDDPNSLKLLPKYDFETKENIDKYYEALVKLDQKDIDNFIKKNKNKTIIVTGFLFDMKIPIDKKYYIKIDDNVHYRQFNLRTLETICEKKHLLKELLKLDLSMKKIKMYSSHGLKLRGPFMAPDFIWKDFVKDPEQDAKKLGYKYIPSDEIFEEIKKMI